MIQEFIKLIAETNEAELTTVLQARLNALDWRNYTSEQLIQLLSLKHTQTGKTVLMYLFSDDNFDFISWVKKLQSLKVQAASAFNILVAMQDVTGKNLFQYCLPDTRLLFLIEDAIPLSADEILTTLADVDNLKMLITHSSLLNYNQKNTLCRNIIKLNLHKYPELTTLLNLAALTYFNINYNSILSWWGDQSIWESQKQKAIIAAREFYRTKNPSFPELYWFVCELRHDIAVAHSRLNPSENPDDDPDLFGRANANNLQQPRTAWVMKYEKLLNTDLKDRISSTGIMEKNAYHKFFSYLEALIKSQSGHANGFQITYMGIDLTKVDMKEKDNIVIQHCRPVFLPKMMEICSNNYNELKRHQQDTADVKLPLLKLFIWCLSQATFCVRSSASISEIIIEALNQELKIGFRYCGHQVPLDLIGLCTRTPEKFISELKSASDKDVLIQDLHQYINAIEEDRSLQQSFFREKTINYPRYDKLCAAGKLMLKLMGDSIMELSSSEKQALNDPHLQPLHARYEAISSLKGWPKVIFSS